MIGHARVDPVVVVLIGLHGPKSPPPGYRARAAAHQDYLVLPEQPWLDGSLFAEGVWASVSGEFTPT